MVRLKLIQVSKRGPDGGDIEIEIVKWSFEWKDEEFSKHNIELGFRLWWIIIAIRPMIQIRGECSHDLMSYQLF